MKKVTLEFFEEQYNDAEILKEELGFVYFSEFMRVSLNQTLRKHAKTIEEAKKRKRHQENSSSKKG